MQKWEYLTSIISYVELKDPKGKKHSAWTGEIPDGSQVEGIESVLNAYGAEGWELVNLVVQVTHGIPADYASGETTSYRAIFKRPVP